MSALATRIRRAGAVASALVAVAIAIAFVLPAVAQDAVPDIPDTQEIERRIDDEERRLAEIQSAINVERERMDALRGEVAALQQGRAALNDELIRTARELSGLETVVSASEMELARLGEELGSVRARFETRKRDLSDTLVVMLRVQRNPPPVLFSPPSDAVDAVRAARLLDRIMPVLREEAAALTADLDRLTALADARQAEHETLLARLTEMSEAQARVALLLEERGAGIVEREGDLDLAREQSAALAADATSLQELIVRLESDVATAREAAQAAREAARERSEERERLAMANTARLAPARPFAATVGAAPRPVAGVTVRDWGDDDGLGGRSQGLSIATRSGAQIVSPADAWVVYAGPYRSYGQLVILNAGDDHHILLAGMDRIQVDLGQFVLAGEPVAVMGGRPLGSLGRFDAREAQTARATPQTSQPSLYVEFRREGRAIDPNPWWARRESAAALDSRRTSGDTLNDTSRDG